MKILSGFCFFDARVTERSWRLRQASPSLAFSPGRRERSFEPLRRTRSSDDLARRMPTPAASDRSKFFNASKTCKRIRVSSARNSTFKPTLRFDTAAFVSRRACSERPHRRAIRAHAVLMLSCSARGPIYSNKICVLKSAFDSRSCGGLDWPKAVKIWTKSCDGGTPKYVLHVWR